MIAERIKRFFQGKDDPEIANAIESMPAFQSLASEIDKAERKRILDAKKEFQNLAEQEKRLRGGPIEKAALESEAALTEELRTRDGKLAHLRENAVQARAKLSDAFMAIVERRRTLVSFLEGHRSPVLTAFAKRCEQLREKLLAMPDKLDEEYREGSALAQAFTDITEWRRDMFQELNVIAREVTDLAYLPDLKDEALAERLRKLEDRMTRQLQSATGTRRHRAAGNPMGLAWTDEGQRSVSTSNWLN